MPEDPQEDTGHRGPITPVNVCSPELSSSTGPTSDFTPIDSRNASANTIVEWPRENQKPTDNGFFGAGAPLGLTATLSPISLRVVLSTAAMWSASNAWRRPNV